jgi:hypothetical protein
MRPLAWFPGPRKDKLVVGTRRLDHSDIWLACVFNQVSVEHLSHFTLYGEELTAVVRVRGRFAWLGAAVVLFGIGAVAIVSTQDMWLDGCGIIENFLIPLAFIPLAATPDSDDTS